MKLFMRDLNAFLPLTPAEADILLTLAEGQRHGYAIMQAISKQTDIQNQHLGPATLYRSIKRLVDHGLIEEVGYQIDTSAGDERRRYYGLTDRGCKVLEAEMQRQSSFVSRTQSILNRRQAARIDQSQEWEQADPTTINVRKS